MSKLEKLKGTGVAIVTPFEKDGRIDYKGLKKLLDHLVKGKADYLVALGTTGESATLSKEEKKELLKFIVEHINGRLPLVVGIGGNNTSEIAEAVAEVNKKQFIAILSVSPYYNKPSQEGIYQHYKAIAAASSLPLILYNVPGRTASNLSSETTLRLANDVKNIVAIKEASGNIEQCMRIIKHKPKNFMLISGDDNLTLPLLACGADGVISVVANAYPKDFSEMVRQALKGDYAKARHLHYKLTDITEQLFADGNPGGVKYVLEYLRICQRFVRLPLAEPNAQVQKKLVELIAQYK